MNKSVLRGCSIFILFFLTLIVSVSAVTISSVSVAEPDTFYSGVGGNDVVRLFVNLSDINQTSGNIVTVTADFSVLGVDCGGSSVITLVQKSGSNTWEGLCDVGDEADSLLSNTFKSEQIWIKANETYGSPDGDTGLVLSLYNINLGSSVNQGVRSSISPYPLCYRFGVGSTNLNDVTDFNNLNDITLIIEASSDSSCIADGLIRGFLWDPGFLPVAKLKFNSINFNNNYVDAQKLTNLSNIIKLRFASSGTYQNTRLTIDTVQLPELNVNTFNVELYHLSLITQQDSFIVSDNDVQASVITWTSNGLDSLLNNAPTYNLKFTVNQGFKGFTITDNVLPVITALDLKELRNISTSNGLISELLINATVNGTGTGVSKVLFYINNVSNTATCTVTSNPEVSNCLLITNKTDGQYNLDVFAYDYGNSSGNVVSSARAFVVQTNTPTLTITSPTATTYTATAGSMLQLNVSASDGNGISVCKYSLDGPSDVDWTSLQNCTTGANVQLYLSDGEYILTVYVNDTLGSTTVKNISFTVKDTKAPVISNNTKFSTKKNATLSVITDEKATCKYDTTDVTYEKMDEKFDANILIHSDKITLAEEGKAYDYYVRCSDLSGNTNKESFKLSVHYGDLVTNTTKLPEVKPDPSESLDILSLPAGKNMIAFDKSYNPISTIALVTNYAAQDIVLKVTTLSSSTLTYSEKVYQYISVEHDGLKDGRIEAANITFRVDKNWLKDNKLTNDDIVLVRFTNDWTVLETKFLREDGNDAYFLAVSPGLSLFAISTKVPEKIVPVVAPAVNTTKNVTNDTQLLSKRSYNWFWVILIAIIVFIVLALIVLVQRNERNSPPPIFPGDRTLMGKLRRLFR